MAANTAARLKEQVGRRFNAELGELDAGYATREIARWAAMEAGGTVFAPDRVGFADGSVLVISVRPASPYNAGTYNVRARAFACAW